MDNTLTIVNEVYTLASRKVSMMRFVQRLYYYYRSKHGGHAKRDTLMARGKSYY